MPSIITDEKYLPPGFVLAKRINYEDYGEDSFFSVIKEHCIENGQPLVVSNMNNLANWDQQVFTLDQLMKYKGEQDLTIQLKTRPIPKIEKLGDYIKTLQQNYNLNTSDQFKIVRKSRALPRKQRKSEKVIDLTLDQTKEITINVDDNTPFVSMETGVQNSLPTVTLNINTVVNSEETVAVKVEDTLYPSDSCSINPSKEPIAIDLEENHVVESVKSSIIEIKHSPIIEIEDSPVAGTEASLIASLIETEQPPVVDLEDLVQVKIKDAEFPPNLFPLTESHLLELEELVAVKVEEPLTPTDSPVPNLEDDVTAIAKGSLLSLNHSLLTESVVELDDSPIPDTVVVKLEDNLFAVDSFSEEISVVEPIDYLESDSRPCSLTKSKETIIKIEPQDEIVQACSEAQNAKVLSKDQAYSEVQTDSEDQTDSEESTAEREFKRLRYSIANVYAKDIDCPIEYYEVLCKIFPEFLLPHGNNDLFSLLPDRFKATNLMCYLGQDGTGTPIHRDLCGTMGHNVMTMATPNAVSEWCIVVNKDREKLAEIIKPSIHEKKKISQNQPGLRSRDTSVTKSSFMESDRAWLKHSKVKNSELEVQVILQRLGDLVIVPSRAYHQVRNKGVSVKIAWNRVTAETLDCAFKDQLPLYRIINRPEVYKCKAIVCFTLKEWSSQLSVSMNNSNHIQNLPLLKYGRDAFIKDANILLKLYFNNILSQEVLSKDDTTNIASDSTGEHFTVKCDFCHSDVFYRYYHCAECNQYDLCMNCYSIGRSCKHVNAMTMRQGPDTFDSLIDVYNSFIQNANKAFKEEVFINNSHELRTLTQIKSNIPSLATVCRRIESYRSVKGDSLNRFTCTHCRKDSYSPELAEKGISLLSIFKRNRCPNTKRVIKPEDIFVCKKCTLECDTCEPLQETNDTMTDYDLVYYAPPSVDERNWGAFFDLDINKVCNYPENSYSSSGSLSPLPSITSSSSPSPSPSPSKDNTRGKKLQEDTDYIEDSEDEYIPIPGKLTNKRKAEKCLSSNSKSKRKTCTSSSSSKLVSPTTNTQKRKQVEDEDKEARPTKVIRSRYN